jgi:hypothetical protein
MAAFVFLAFALSWGWAAAACYTGLIKMPFQAGDVWVVAFLFGFMCGPAIAALILSAFSGNMKEVLRFRMRPNAWWVAGWVIALTIVGGAWWIALHLPGAQYLPIEVEAQKNAMAQTGKPLPVQPHLILPLLLLQALVVAPLINMIATLTEELGWRGYMLTKMAAQSFWNRHLTIGFFWGLWHAPIIVAGHNYPGEPLLGPIVFIIFCMLMSPIIGLVAERGKSVLAAGLFHGTINAAGPVSVLSLGGLTAFQHGIVGWPGLAVMAAGCALIGLLRLDRT